MKASSMPIFLAWLLVTDQAVCLVHGFSSLGTNNNKNLHTRPSTPTSFAKHRHQYYHHGPSSSALTSTAISSNSELLPGIAAIDQGNAELFANLESIRETPYFRFFSVDILASCEYMPQELFECYTEGCEILPVDEDEVRFQNTNKDASCKAFKSLTRNRLSLTHYTTTTFIGM